MKCNRCGKALGTDRGICPFCGSLMSKDQMEIYKKERLKRMLNPEMITEKYGEKPVYYEKNKNYENKVLGVVVVLGVLLILMILALIFVLN